MKNTKAIFFIILGAFIMATGFAFAGPAYDSLANGPFGTPVAGAPVNKAILDTSGAAPVPAASAPAAAAAPTVPAPTAVAAAPAEPKPTFGEKVKEFLGTYKKDILRTGISAYLGFALLGGPAGLLIGALVGFAFFFMAGMSAVGRKK
jgi:hypothetical protein